MADTGLTQQNKQSQVESQQAKKPDPIAPDTQPVFERPALAAGEDAIERHIQLLGDNRIHAGKRQKLAGWINRTRGNQYLQRVIDSTQKGSLIQRDPNGETTAAGAGEGGGAGTQTLEQQLTAAMEGLGTDEAAILTAIRNASVTDRQRVLGNSTIMGQLRSELGGSDLFNTLEALGAPLVDLLSFPMEGWGTDEATLFRLTANAPADQRRTVIGNGGTMSRLRGELSGNDLLTVARNLANGLRSEEQVSVANGLFNLSSVPAGKIRDATGLLMLSTEAVDRNTAQLLVNGGVTAYYIDDLSQPPNVDQVVTGYGRDPADWTLYYQPNSKQMVWVQKNAQGFRIHGQSNIFGFKNLTIDRWKTLLVHETNHARNPDPTTPLENYKSEFRAYWVAEYRVVADLDERARQIKTHVLNDYPEIKAAYDADEAVRNAINAHTRPDENITNK